MYEYHSYTAYERVSWLNIGSLVSVHVVENLPLPWKLEHFLNKRKLSKKALYHIDLVS
jgi:hypothetical protein